MELAIGLMWGSWGLSLLLTLYGTVSTLRHFRKTTKRDFQPFREPSISILKPLKGLDEGLKENLRSFFHLDYPDYELLFSVADSEDPAAKVVKDLIAEYPYFPAKLVVGAAHVGRNPKINNLIRSYSLASYDWILISDSNIRVNPDYLKNLASQIQPGTGIITSVVAGTNPTGMGAHLECMYLNTFYARGMMVTSDFGHPCVIGKSMLFQRSTASRFGGIRNLSQYLAEDYMAGEAMRKLGLRAVIATRPVQQFVGKRSFREFWQRHVRWGRIRKAQAPIPFILEPFLGSILSGIIGGVAASRSISISFPVFFVAHMILWGICDYWVTKTLFSENSSRGVKLTSSVFWILRELFALPLWAHIACGNTVDWRGKRYAIQSGGLLESTSVESGRMRNHHAPTYT